MKFVDLLVLIEHLVVTILEVLEKLMHVLLVAARSEIRMSLFVFELVAELGGFSAHGVLVEQLGLYAHGLLWFV